MSDSMMGHINDLEDRVSLLKEAIKIANETIDNLSKERDTLREQAETFKRAYRQADKDRHDTACEADALRAELAAEREKV